jgi:hypothetical protein
MAQEITFTADDRILAQATDREADISPSLGLRSKLLQNTSAALSVHEPGYMKGSKSGDYDLLYSDGEHALVDGSTGFVCSPVAFRESYVERSAEDGSFVAVSDEAPEGSAWGTTADGRRAFLAPNGHRVEETVSACLLVNGRGVILDFKSTSLRIGRDFHDRASHCRAVVDGVEVWGFGVSKWRITSRLERGPRGSWFTPVAVMTGRLGDPDGPTVPEWRLAVRARVAFKQGLDWASPAALEALPPPSPGAEPQMSRRRRAAIEGKSADKIPI